MSHQHGHASTCPDTPADPLCLAYQRGYATGRNHPGDSSDLIDQLRHLRAINRWLREDRDKIAAAYAKLQLDTRNSG